jgi:hypothetical protein
MPVYHKVEQRSPDWFLLRAGRPTASNFHKIITPKTLKLSAQADGYMNFLIAERMLGHPIVEDFRSDYMQRGQELEDESVRAYEFETEVETMPGGFVEHTSGFWGCSPDRLIGSGGILEMKCPSPAVHVGYLLTGEVETEYRIQLQGQLLCCDDRDFTDVVSYHPNMPAAIIRVRRDEGIIKALGAALMEFSEDLQARVDHLVARFGPMPTMALAPQPAAEPAPGDAGGSLGVSDADIDRMLAGNKEAF